MKKMHADLTPRWLESAQKQRGALQCPNCSELVAVKGIGRKPLNIPLNNVYDALRTNRSVAGAAHELGCSPAYIFGVLKKNGLKLMDVLNERS